MTEQPETPDAEPDGDAQEPAERKPPEFRVGGFLFGAEWSDDRPGQ